MLVPPYTEILYAQCVLHIHVEETPKSPEEPMKMETDEDRVSAEGRTSRFQVVLLYLLP